MIARDILPELTRWAAESEQPELARALPRQDRVRLYFGTEGRALGRGARARSLRAAV